MFTYEMLVHRRPFQGQTRQEVFDEILHREPKPPRQLDPQLPADLERICLKCLSKDATQRYLTAADLAKDLRHAHQAPQRRKRRMMTIASVVAAGLLILAAFWGYLTQQGEQPVISVQPGAGFIIRHRATLRGHSDAVWSVAFSPDGLTLASASGDRSIAVWDRETGKLQYQITGHEGDVRSVTFLPGGNQLVSGSVDRTIRFWELETGGQQQAIATHRAAVQSVVCSRDGRKLASTGDDRTIQLRSVATGELLFTLTGHTDGVTQVAFSPDGRRLASASWDKTIRIWDVGSGKLLRTIDKPESAVRSVAFSPDGRRLVSGGEDHTIRLWNAETGVELATLRGHQGSVTSVAFSSDGSILASASADKTVMMWELEEATAARRAEPPKPAKVDRKPVKIPPAAPQEPPLAIAPFDADTARKHQEAWADYLGEPVEFENSIGMRFVLIPPGEFDMGSTEEEVAEFLKEAKGSDLRRFHESRLPSEVPKHRVRITKPFWLGRHQVTRGQFRQFVDARGYQTDAERDGQGGYGLVDGNWKQGPHFLWNTDLGFPHTDEHPVVNITSNDMVAFCEWLTEKEGVKCQFPTEAQWEYACRAGSTTAWHWGNDETELPDYAWFVNNSSNIMHPVGQLRSNAWELYDMHGNVWECCQDWWANDYYSISPLDDPLGPPAGSDRVSRGGAMDLDALGCRASYRAKFPPEWRGWGLGFRLVRAVSDSQRRVHEVTDAVSGDLESFSPKTTRTPVLSDPRPSPLDSWNLSPGSPPPAIAPFDADRAKQHQKAWAEHSGVPVEFENSIGMKFVLIPPGEFDMGSTEEEVEKLLEEARVESQASWYIDQVLSEAPKHRVWITRPFWLGCYEVTRGQFRRFVEDSGCHTEAERDGKGGYGLVDAQRKQDPRFVWNRDLEVEQPENHPVVQVSWNDVTAFCEWLSTRQIHPGSTVATNAAIRRE